MHTKEFKLAGVYDGKGSICLFVFEQRMSEFSYIVFQLQAYLEV